MFSLTDRVAIITGASRGIGKAIARTLAAAGARVICTSRNLKALEEVAGDLRGAGWKAEAEACDVADYPALEKLVRRILAEYDQVDILVNNAGITRDALIMRLSEEDWNTVLDTNLKGAFNGIKAVSRAMLKRRSGRIINITSVVGLTGNAGQANYAASKAGLIGLTKSAAKEFASRGITVNCIAPGYIQTDMTAQLSEAQKTALLGQIPVGRMGRTEDVAAVALFLAAEESNYITGHTITVDGGLVMSV